MENSIFRKKSTDKLQSPENLSDFIRVSNPPFWLILLAALLLLGGILTLGFAWRFTSGIEVSAVCRDGVLTCYVREDDISSARGSSGIRAEGAEYAISDISASPVQLNANTDTYLMHLGGLSGGDWVYEITSQAALPDGIYSVTLLTKSESPISFLMN